MVGRTSAAKETGGGAFEAAAGRAVDEEDGARVTKDVPWAADRCDACWGDGFAFWAFFARSAYDRGGLAAGLAGANGAGEAIGFICAQCRRDKRSRANDMGWMRGGEAGKTFGMERLEID